MINISNKNDYFQTSVHKDLSLTIGATTIRNSNIILESLSISEILMAEEQLTFGGCNASQLSVSINLNGSTLLDSDGNDITNNLVGQDLIAKITVNSVDVPLGKYTITSVTTDNKINTLKIVALDYLNKANIDVSEWYNELEFPMTLGNFRTSLFTHLGIATESVSMPLDSILIYKGYTNTQINAKSLIKAICELNGSFGKMNRNGIFHRTVLNNIATDVTDGYKEITYEKFTTNAIDCVIVKLTDGTLYKYGTGTNPYVLNNSFLIGMSKTEIDTVCASFLNIVGGIQYVPTEVSMVGLPYVETGDRLKIDSTEFYVFNRKINGIQVLKDTITSKGKENLETNLNSLQQKIMDLNTDVNNVKIEVTETSEGLKSKVSKGDVSSEISQESDTITLSGNRLIVNSTNFKLDADGNVDVLGNIETFDKLVLKSTQTSSELAIDNGGAQVTDYYEVIGNDGVVHMANPTIDYGSIIKIDSSSFANVYASNKIKGKDVGCENLYGDNALINKLKTTEIIGKIVKTHNGADLDTVANDTLNLKYLGYTIPSDCPVQNYVDENGVFHQKVSRVDLGSLSWSIAKDTTQFNTSNLVGKITTTNRGNIFCKNYETTTTWSVVEQTSGYIFTLNGKVFINDDTYTTASAFKTAIQGTYFYYELDTEILHYAELNQQNIDVKYLGYSVPPQLKVQNYLDVDGVFHQRVARVDASTLDWGLSVSGSNTFRTFSIKPKVYIFDGYEFVDDSRILSNATANEYLGDKQTTYSHSNTVDRIYLKDALYSDATSLKNGLKGKYIYYELATEVTLTDGQEVSTKFASKDWTRLDGGKTSISISSVYASASEFLVTFKDANNNYQEFVLPKEVLTGQTWTKGYYYDTSYYGTSAITASTSTISVNTSWTKTNKNGTVSTTGTITVFYR